MPVLITADEAVEAAEKAALSSCLRRGSMIILHFSDWFFAQKVIMTIIIKIIANTVIDIARL